MFSAIKRAQILRVRSRLLRQRSTDRVGRNPADRLQRIRERSDRHRIV